MEIHFETTKNRDTSIQRECDDECPDGPVSISGGDDECPDTHRFSFAASAFLADSQSAHRDMCTFRHAAELYMQPYDDEYSVVCNPTEQGRIAVLDQEATELLRCFHSPISLADLGKQGVFSEQASAAITLFTQLGFLEDIAHTPTGTLQGEPETLSAWLHMTNACNLRCDYCYLDKTPDAMADDTSRRAIDAIFRSASKQHFQKVHLRYAGGEASLQGERVIALHDYASAQAQMLNIGLYASILSNGVFIGQRMMERLKKRNIGIMISLDGVGAQHDQQRPFANGRGSFQFVDRTITQLLATKHVPHISVTVSQRNLAGLPELITYILERDMPFSLNYYRDNDCSTHIRDLQFKDDQMIDAMRSVFTLIEGNLPRRSLLGSLIDKANLQHTRSRTCGVGQSYLVIDQKGGVAKCHADIKRTVTTIAADDPLAVIRSDRSGVQGYAVNEKEGCRSCSWRNWCSGGCPLLTYRTTGRNDIKSPNCSIYKALFPGVLRLEALRLLKYTSSYPLVCA